MTTKGKIVTVNGNMITVAFEGAVAQNEVGYALVDNKRLMAEIVRVRGTRCDMQVFESTTGLGVGDPVEFTGNLLAAELGPPLIATVDMPSMRPQLREPSTVRSLALVTRKSLWAMGRYLNAESQSAMICATHSS